MKLYIRFGICLSLRWFHLKTNFSPFLKCWADNSSTNQCSYQLLHGLGMTHLVPFYHKNAYCGEGPDETPAALRCLSHLINSFLTDIKQLAKTSGGGGGAFSVPLLMSMSKAFSAPFTLIKL